jgi:molybdate transport system substrate-binding protein
MKVLAIVFAAAISVCGWSRVAQTAEIKVLSAAGIKSVVEDLGAKYEKTSGHKLVLKFVGGPAVQEAIASGEDYDVAISQPSQIDRLLKDGKIIATTRIDIARSGMGFGVRKSAAKPDITSADGFKRALLGASSIAYAGDGASGVFFNGLFERLGIAAEIKPKLKSMPAGTPSAEAVARGEAEIVLLSVPSILAVSGVDLVGPLPRDLQFYSGFAGGVVSTSKQADAGGAFIKLLASEEALPVLKAKGLEPAK